MPLFVSDEEFRRCSDDAGLVAEKADAFIRDLYAHIETVRAEADAGSITLEQTCSMIEQNYVSLSADYASLQSQHSELSSSLEQRAAELGRVQAEKQQLLLQSIEKDGELERLRREASELHRSKRQLMEMLERKDLEISEKSATVKSFLDKIVNMTENAALKDARLRDLESEMGRLRATSDRFLQEKELIERHNTWLNEELTAKVDSLNQLRKTNGELEAEISSKLEDVENKFKECSRSLKSHKGRVRELEEKLSSVEGELLSTKDAAAAAEDHFSAELSTVNKLVDLYKESSEEWSKKAGDLEGVIKALETHLNQVESEYKDGLEHEVSARKEGEKEFADLKEKLQACKAELENLKKENDLNNLPLSSFTTGLLTNSVDAGQMVENDRAIIPQIPAGVSGTALAASLLRDGWTLTKMYAKYHEAVDALRHEQLGRKQSQAILERVLYEIEEKAGAIMDEREEHERLLEAYSALDQKLQDSLSERSALEITTEELKANLKKQARDNVVAQKEIVDLQTQVAILLKECRDVQLRCGSVARNNDDKQIVYFNSESNAEDIISERLLTFKDISGLVEQNVQLRSLVRNLSDQVGEKEAELKDKYEKEIQMHTSETASKVNAVLLRAEEQARMIESLHTSVAMYKKLYEEEHKRRSFSTHQQDVPEQGSREVVMLQESSRDASRKVQEQTFERLKNLEEDLEKSRNAIISLRSERDKLALETQFAQEKLARFMKEFELQREENRGLIARNDKFSQMIVDYQKKLRESAESVDASSELSRKLTMEVSVLKCEKEILENAEKRASEEVRDLSERLHRLQATLSTIQSTGEVREDVRSTERRKQEEYISKIEREWAEAKKELQEERDNVRRLSLERDSTLKNALGQVEELRKELAEALQSLSAAESRAAVAEARRSDLEKIVESARKKDSGSAEGGPSSSSEKILANFRDEIEKLRVEAQASKDHMLQYKNIAQVNEDALKQMESVHENFRSEADEVKRSLEAELHSLKQRVNELEDECKLKTEEAISANSGKEEALAGALSEISRLKDYYSVKMSQIVTMESQIFALKGDLEGEHQRWRAAQDNYERQVILQSETIQELTKTSQALSSAQEEISELRKVVDVLKTENNDLKSKWETEKLTIEVYRTEADKKYREVNELNKILHSRLEALHIKLAEKERGVASGNSSVNFGGDDGLQNVVNYLRRSKEITETEFSLLKQEKHRLQSQLENAMKSIEALQSSLHTERAKSQASLLTEEEFKSLQLQIRELTLLRESNVQLREENRHNFEECQKLREVLQNVRTESENLEKLLSVRDTELEAHRKEVDRLKMERVNLEKRIEELVEKCKGVDIDDYNRLKESFQLMQVNLREKDAELAEIKKLLSEKQDTISILERDVARSRTEVNERETRINDLLQAEASLKSEFDRFKRLNGVPRRKFDIILKEKEDLSKEVQSLSKQLEDAKQVKATKVLDFAGEQALREKEKEKDTRIQTLERTLERHREDLKKGKEDHQKEKERRQNLKKMVLASRATVGQEQQRLLDELNKHKQALRALQGEVDKLKNSGGSQSENTQNISTSLLEDFVSAYFQAVDNLDQVMQPAINELDSATTDAPPPDSTTFVGTQAGQASTQTPAPPAANVSLTRTNEERERRLALSKANVKMGRKLVRPNITKPKEPQGDVEMSAADDSNTVTPSHNTESQEIATVQTTAIVRKRPSSTSFSSDLQEEMLASEDASPDIPAPLLKKSKASESPQEGCEELTASPTKPSEVVVSTEETADDGGNVQQGNNNEEIGDAEKDESETEEDQVEEELAVNEPVQIETLRDTDEVVADEKPSETVVVSNEQLRDQTEQDIQQMVTGSDDREEGEMDAEFADIDADVDFQGERVEPENSPSAEPLTPSIMETGEIDPEDEKNGETSENIIDGSNKVVSDIADPTAETDRAPVSSTTEEATGTSVDIGASEQGGSTPPPVSPLNSTSTTINLQERARQRAHLRQFGMGTSTSSTPTRGQGRLVRGRGRGVRGGRTPRGQSPG